MKSINIYPTQPLKRIFSFFVASCFSLLSIPVHAQNDLIEEIKALAKVKKSTQFNPAEMPTSPNPYLSLLPPGTKLDYEGWRNYYRQRTQSNRLSQSPVTSNLDKKWQSSEINEKERFPGQNDTQRRGQFIKRFSSRHYELNRVVIHGISGKKDGELEFHPAKGMEDDGSIPLANVTKIKKNFIGERYQGFIGDGPVPGLSDFDFYKVKAKSGQTLSVDLNTPEPFLDLDSFVSIFDESGQVLDFNDDDEESYDSKLFFEIPYDGTFYVCVAGFGAFLPFDPFDSESGSATDELGSEGEYELLIGFIELSDVDFYVFNLKKGDVLAAAINSKWDETLLTIHNPKEELEIATIHQASFNYPSESPLSLVGNSNVSYIAEQHGTYAISVSNNDGAYDLELFVTRPNLEMNGGTQIVFLDFDGAEFDVNEFLGIPGSDVRQLSPFRNFLANWEISDDPFTIFKLTRRITNVVKENLKRDLQRARINPSFNVVIIGNTGLNNSFGISVSNSQSNLHAQAEGFNENIAFHGLDNSTLSILGEFDTQAGFKNSSLPISRVIVGGTIDESGIGTIGIAQSIDPGNFATKETALVLLDILSASPVGDPLSFSLNDVPLAPGVTIEDLVVLALGNIIAHEVGHYLGNWHTDGFNNVQTLMDEGPGGIFNLIGMEPFGVFGDNQTIDVDYITDDYSTREIFFGNENTKNQTAWALSSSPKYLFEQIIAHSNQTMGIELSQTYPNPSTIDEVLSIDFKVYEKSQVQLEIFDSKGEKVAVLFNDMAEAEQEYRFNFDPSFHRLKSGTYIYRLSSDKGAISKRMYLKE